MKTETIDAKDIVAGDVLLFKGGCAETTKLEVVCSVDGQSGDKLLVTLDNGMGPYSVGFKPAGRFIRVVR